MHESLLRTLGKYLEATHGAKAFSKLSDWKRRDAKNLLSHNNFAERPFAMVKGLMKRFPSLKLSHTSAIASAKAKGTFDADGAANTSDPILKDQGRGWFAGLFKATTGGRMPQHPQHATTHSTHGRSNTNKSRRYRCYIYLVLYCT
jgi:hypothetical protein